jgi:hypothetical protein
MTLATAINNLVQQCNIFLLRMPSSGMWRRVNLAQAGSSLSDFSILKMEAIRSCETSVHTRFTRRHIPEDGILHSHRREKLKSYILLSPLLVRLC